MAKKNKLYRLFGGLVLALGIGLVLQWAFVRPSEQPPPTRVPPAPVDLPALMARAEHGDASAQEKLGKAYATGNGTRVDYKTAAKWFALAATNGNADAEAELGELYQAGQGVPRNAAMAAKLFAQAAESNSVTAEYDLAYLYEQGQGVPKNEKLAAKWYRAASEMGDPTAQYDYGQRCLLGLGMEKDPVEGLKWLLLAKAHGQASAAAKISSFESAMSRAQIEEAKKRAERFVPRSLSSNP